MKKPTNVLAEGTTRKYLIGLSAMAVALLFFLFSEFLFGDEDQSEIQQTPLDEPLHLRGAGDLVVEEWTYNPSKNLMIVTLNVNKSTSILNDTLSFVAQEKEHPNRELPTHVEYHDERRYVVSIQQVSPSFDVMALDITKEKNEHFALETEEQPSLKEGEEKEELARIYTDQREVQHDQTLSIQTEQEYEVAAISQDIKQAQQEVVDKEDQIQKNDDQLKEMEQEMVELESQQMYETEEEKEQTTARIDQLENEVDRLQRETTEHETTIQTLQEKIKMLKEKREMMES
ncbi:hypothetical protein [Halobacillus sp. A5]|uniref:hypothetical protein n=1 Tax=Halobacillus sp. A5 TaxID=2880263 RepID=UPI0020A6D912|nr:hypothetical protein [Halobacillus sp. A5]MCP3028776.1 hypothetical protein [Halobacillus sp. A5]